MSEARSAILEGKRILVTGGTGSMGKTFVKKALSGLHGTPAKVVVLSRDEGKHHDMRVDYLHRRVATDDVLYRNFLERLEFRVGDVRNIADLAAALRGCDIVVHAAAMKQVPTCEYFPGQAVLTNCIGAQNLVQAIEEHRFPIESVVAISTDKACKPVNAMGMTKALQERIIVAGNVLIEDTRLMCVRYGNVLASRGSVIPLFLDQIRHGGPVTITDERMTRFLLSLDEAVETVFAALRHGRRGEILVPKAPGAKVVDIAAAMIGDRNVPLEFTGIRPGEKIHEIMLSEEEVAHTVERGDYLAVLPMLPELADPETARQPRPLATEMSSGDSVLDREGTRLLLERNGLLHGAVASGELLR